MAKILHVTPSFYPAFVYGGPIETGYQLCKHTSEMGEEIRVLSTNANGPYRTLNVRPGQEVEIDGGIKVCYCQRWRGTLSLSFFRMLPNYIRWADIVHLTAVYSPPTIPTLLLSRIYRKPVVWSARGALLQFPGRSKPLIKAIWNKICSFVAPHKIFIHVSSEKEEIDSQRAFPNIKMILVPNGVNIPKDIPKKGQADRLRLLFLGRLHPHKGIRELLSACNLLKKDAHNFTLTIAGEGDGPYVEEMNRDIENFGLSNYVHTVGHVSGEAKDALIEKTDVLVLPSLFESFGNVVVEALAFGVPVIASRSTPWSELEEKGCGLWVENSPESLAKAIRDIATMPMAEMGARGRKWIENNFKWSIIAKQMLRHYSELLKL